jgi:hypothetical protein
MNKLTLKKDVTRVVVTGAKWSAITAVKLAVGAAIVAVPVGLFFVMRQYPELSLKLALSIVGLAMCYMMGSGIVDSWLRRRRRGY